MTHTVLGFSGVWVVVGFFFFSYIILIKKIKYDRQRFKEFDMRVNKIINPSLGVWFLKTKIALFACVVVCFIGLMNLLL